jgi:hypothetical protein
MIQITTEDCEFNKQTGDLVVESQFLGGRFPNSLEIKSSHTGRVMLFKHITPDHPRYDEDGWDGEMALYAPTELCKVKLLTAFHGQ